MNLYESIRKLNKEADEDFKQHVLNDFKLFLDDHDITEPTNQDVNDYFAGMFYDLETEDDLNDMNKAEEIIRTEYKVDPTDESVYEPTEEDVAEANHWYDDDPREDWDAGRTNDYYNVAGFDKERELERLHANESEMKDLRSGKIKEATELPVYQVSSNPEDDIQVPTKLGKFLKLDDINITTDIHTNTKDANDIKKEYHITGYYSPIDTSKLPEGLSWDSGQGYFDYNVNNKEYEQFTPEDIFYYPEDNYDAIYDIENDMDQLINSIIDECFEIRSK